MLNDLLQRFAEWAKLKIKIHNYKDIDFYFRDREIWWVSIGQNIGSEQNGKNVDFERPVLVIKKFNRKMFLGVPTSSKLGNSPYHYIFLLDGKKYSANISQIRAFSSKRLLRKIDKMPLRYFHKIREMLSKMT